MKSLLLTCLVALPLTTYAQGQNGSSSEFRERAKKDAADQLQKAVAGHDWKMVKESADALEKLEKADKLPDGTPPTLYARAADGGFSLSRSPDEDKKASRFGFSHDYQKKSGTVLEADFYLKWSDIPRPISEAWWNTLAVSAQGKLSGANNNSSDAWRFRIEDSLWSYNKSENRKVDGFVLTGSGKSESDRDFKTTRLSAELWATLNAGKACIGQYSGGNDDWVQFRWRPYVGIDIGDTIASNAATPAAASSILWGMTRGRADLRLNFLLKPLKINDVVAFVDDKLLRISSTGETCNYLSTGIDFELNEFVGLTLQYATGRDAPKFEREQLFKGGLTLKF